MTDSADSASLFSMPLVVLEEKKKCLAKVVQVFQNLEHSQQDYQEISNLLQLHDDLSNLLPKEGNNESDSKIHQSVARYFWQLRLGNSNDKSSVEKELEDNWKKQLFEYLAIEADLYRAMALTSLYLMQSLPMATNLPLSQPVQEGLKSCVQQSQLLLKIIDQRVQSSALPNQDESAMDQLLEHYTTEYSERLEGWLLQYDEEDKNDNNIIAFDKEQLQLEEEELMHMAATPTPNEAASTMTPAQHSAKDLTSLSARLIQEDVTANPENDSMEISPETSQYSTLIRLNDHGVFQSQHPQEEAWWWRLSSESSVQCDPQKITIRSVVSNRPKLALLPSIELHCDGTLWWFRISRLIQSLQSETDLQQQVASLWPSIKVKAMVQQARTIIATT